MSFTTDRDAALAAWRSHRGDSTKQQWCRFVHPVHGPCSFGLGHRIEYHACNGERFDLRGDALTATEFTRITRNGTR